MPALTREQIQDTIDEIESYKNNLPDLPAHPIVPGLNERHRAYCSFVQNNLRYMRHAYASQKMQSWHLKAVVKELRGMVAFSDHFLVNGNLDELDRTHQEVILEVETWLCQCMENLLRKVETHADTEGAASPGPSQARTQGAN